MSGDQTMSTSSSPGAMQREGIALPIALAAIVAVGALIAGVFFASTQEYRVGRNTLATQNALHGAEVGLNSVVSSWTPARTIATTVGQTVIMKPDTTIGGALVQRQYTRVSPTMFWVTSTAIAGSLSLQARALKRLNTLVRVDIPDMKIQGAVTVRGNVSVSGNATVSGNDVTPAGWPDCIEAGAPSAGLVVGDSTANASSSGGCGVGNTFTCVSGSPKIADSSIYADSSTYKNFGGFSYDSLTKLATADKIFTAGGTVSQIYPRYKADNSCDKAHLSNWGDTSHVDLRKECDDYYPVVWLKGQALSWTIANYGGQGILLIDGNARFNGLFKWTGLVIVQGAAEFAGSLMAGAPRITGGVMVMNRNNATPGTAITGTPTIQFSRCALQAVTARLATARQTKYRAGADMSF
jgi:hypothetical protein